MSPNVLISTRQEVEKKTGVKGELKVRRDRIYVCFLADVISLDLGLSSELHVLCAVYFLGLRQVACQWIYKSCCSDECGLLVLSEAEREREAGKDRRE